MVRKVEQRRVRGALDRFGPPLQSSGIELFKDSEVETSAHSQATLQVKRSYRKVAQRPGGSLTASHVLPASGQ